MSNSSPELHFDMDVDIADMFFSRNLDNGYMVKQLIAACLASKWVSTVVDMMFDGGSRKSKLDSTVLWRWVAYCSFLDACLDKGNQLLSK